MPLKIPLPNGLITALEQPPGQDQGSNLPSTYLVIPYFAGDRGRPGIERPLGTKAVYYLCSSIEVNGIKGGQLFERGKPTTVTVWVANSGSGTMTAPVQATVWWCDPSTGFVLLNLFGQTSVPVPTDGVPRRSPDIIGIIPVTAPAHVCLIARVSSPFDTPALGTTVAPADDRHWAQLNLNAVAASIGHPFHFTFWAGNPTAQKGQFHILARQASEETIALLSRQMHKELSQADLRLALDDRRGTGVSRYAEGGAQIQVSLKPGERRAITLTGILPKEMEPRQTVIVEILQISANGERSSLIGSIGLVVTAQKLP